MLLKDQLFNEASTRMLFENINAVYPINIEDSVKEVLMQYPKLELKERISCLTSQLHRTLNMDFESAVKVFDEVIEGIDGEHFVYGAILEYLETYGCNDDYYQLAIPRLGEYTKVFSAEFAIRPFINKYPKETINYVKKWCRSDNVHTRRLASEGTRPILPWAMNINLNPSEAIEWLEVLLQDEERYVTRSVANHLNDISKSNPDLVIETLSKWMKTRHDKEMDYIINHSLRTLIKRGNQDALSFLGFKNNPNVSLKEITFRNQFFTIGEKVPFTVEIEFRENVNILVDYILWFQSKSGRPSKKVYKMTKVSGSIGELVTVKGRIDLTQRTTRKIFSGLHKIDIQVNGSVLFSHEFMVEEKVK